MEARSYVENIATRTAILRMLERMTRNACIALVVAGGALLVGTGLHPAGVIVGTVLAVGAFVVGRASARLGRERRDDPLDLGFEPVPARYPTPGPWFGTAIALALFGAVFTALSFAARPDLATIVGGGLLGAAVLVSAVASATVGLEQRRWRELDATLAAHPELVAYLADARRRFPSDAPFPFEAPTDGVTIPPHDGR